MIGSRALIHLAVLFLLPVFAAWFGWSVPAAIGVSLIMLVWRWLISLSVFVAPVTPPDLVLETISASHFVEKVRWNLDRTRIDYEERASGGTLGAFFLGRTVPRLKARTGAVVSQIGNSAEILRYLWGVYSVTREQEVRHLQPTPERLDLEQRVDRYGSNLQVWVYYHLLDHRELCLHAWGVNSTSIPGWQRAALQWSFPLLRFLIRRSFQISESHYEKACGHIEALLAEIDAKLGDGRGSLLGGDTLNFTDFAFAAMTGLWQQPDRYGGGKADNVRLDHERVPHNMLADIRRWNEDYPRAVEWVEQLYARER